MSFPFRSDDLSGRADIARQDESTLYVTRERLAGYRQAAEAAGLDWSTVWVEERVVSQESEGRAAGLKLLQQDPRPTAIIAMSDHLALGVIDAARMVRVNVPTELTVVGFDDIPDAATARVPLTTVRQPLAEKGRLAGRLFFDALNGHGPTGPVTRILPTELVVRASSAPAAR